MNINTFLTCLGFRGVGTGTSAALEGIYSPSSGSTGYFWNQLYTTGAHFQNGVLYAPTMPLITIAGTGVNQNIYTGSQGHRVGYQHSGNFSVLMDIEYNGCQRTVDNKGYVLLTTVDSPSQFVSGFSISINDSNRLYFKTLNKAYTLTQELGSRDWVYIALSENQFVTFGLYKVEDDQFYGLNVALESGALDTKAIYFGNFLNNDQPLNYQGYKGKINNILLFNDGLSDQDIAGCSICGMTTGHSVINNVISFSGLQLTGYYFSGITDIQSTGSLMVTGRVYRSDGSFINVVYPQPMTGLVTSGEFTLPLFKPVTIQVSGISYNFLYDTGALATHTKSTIEFDLALSSGDVVEIYNYQFPNKNIGKKIQGLEWPDETGFIQLYGNGLSETINVDFYLDHNSISGYRMDDVLSYDTIVADSVVTAYSGYWQTSHWLMSGGMFPAQPQYLEVPAFTGQVKILTLDGVCVNNPFFPNFGYDLHLNGQKLISGLQYHVNMSGSGFVVSLSGQDLPPLNVDFLYHPSGGLPTGIENIDDNELSFIPHFPGFQRTQINVSSANLKFWDITGCSEQIWVNGLRQLEGIDYVKHGYCDNVDVLLYPVATPHQTYNSYLDQGFWNFSLPPYINNVSGSSIFPGDGFAHILCSASIVAQPSYTGNKCEGHYMFYGQTDWNMYGIVDQGLNIADVIYNGSTDGTNKGYTVFRWRYRDGNIIGDWTYSNRITTQF